VIRQRTGSRDVDGIGGRRSCSYRNGQDRRLAHRDQGRSKDGLDPWRQGTSRKGQDLGDASGVNGGDGTGGPTTLWDCE
jgi:hypothetical protein